MRPRFLRGQRRGPLFRADVAMGQSAGTPPRKVSVAPASSRGPLSSPSRSRLHHSRVSSGSLGGGSAFSRACSLRWKSAGTIRPVRRRAASQSSDEALSDGVGRPSSRTRWASMEARLSRDNSPLVSDGSSFVQSAHFMFVLHRPSSLCNQVRLAAPLASVEPGFDGTDRCLDDGCNLFVAHPLDIGQYQHAAVRLGDLTERAPKLRLLLDAPIVRLRDCDPLLLPCRALG
jgi:hypothetical protein